MATNALPRLSEQEYLEIERAAETKSEFFDGEMYAMAGTSLAHADLQSNVQFEVRSALRGGDCRVYGPDLRVKIGTGKYVYPDVIVVCGKPQLADEHQDNLLNPSVVVEILSPSTANYDRGFKFQKYRTILSLRDYILVDQSEMRVEQYTRQPDNTWLLRDYEGAEAELRIDSIGIAINLGRLYDRVQFSATEDLPAASAPSEPGK